MYLTQRFIRLNLMTGTGKRRVITVASVLGFVGSRSLVLFGHFVLHKSNAKPICKFISRN